MDPLTHSLCGAALAKTRLGKASRLAPVALILGANVPDVDLLWSGWHEGATYLVHHRGFTHSIAGVVVCALALAAVVRFVERRIDAAAPAGWKPWLLPALAGVATHPMLDLLNTYGVRPWLPFSHERYYADLVFIVDPWLWLLFGGTAALAGARTRAGSIVWSLLAATTTFYLLREPRTPPLARFVFPAGVALVALLRAVGVGALRPARALRWGSVAVALYLGGLEVCARVAERRLFAAQLPPAIAAEESGALHRMVMRSPWPADPTRWRFYFESGDSLWWRDLVRFHVVEDRDLGPRRLADPRVLAVAETPEAAAWRYFARIPRAWIDESRSPSRVVLDDARYNWRDQYNWTSIPVEPSAATTR
jgi:inner membrane protein